VKLNGNPRMGRVSLRNKKEGGTIKRERGFSKQNEKGDITNHRKEGGSPLRRTRECP